MHAYLCPRTYILFLMCSPSPFTGDQSHIKFIGTRRKVCWLVLVSSETSLPKYVKRRKEHSSGKLEIADWEAMGKSACFPVSQNGWNK